MTVTLFVPCFVDQLFPKVAISMVQILERLGHEIEYPAELGCCGQPPFNAGYWEAAREAARPVLNRLKDAEAIVIASGSCGAMLKVFYKQLFAEQPEEKLAVAVAERCWEFSDFLVNRLQVTDLGAVFPHRVTYHDGCHGLRELGLKKPARELLGQVQGLELIEMAEAETCCGFGGTFAAKFPSISTAMGEVKCASALQTSTEYLVSGDSSCLMHLQGLANRQQLPLKSIHLAEILASR